MMASSEKALQYLYVTYVDVDRELLKIWGQKNRICASYIERQLLQMLPEFNKIQCPNPSQIHKGIFCYAKYTDDNYYRARVLSLVHNDSVGVLFVDYGNRDIVKLSNIRIPKNINGDVLLKMAEQAEEYYLARVAAPSMGWTKEIVSEIRRDICYEEFPFLILTQAGDRKIIEIQFRNDDFSNYLIKKQLATPLSLPAQSQIILTYCPLTPNEIKPESSSREVPKVAYSPPVPPNLRSQFSTPNEGMMQLNYGKPYNAMNLFPTSLPLQQQPPKHLNSSFQQMNRNIPENPSFSPVNFPANQLKVRSNCSLPVKPVLNPLDNNQFSLLQSKSDSPDPFTENNFIQILAQQVKRYIAEDNAKNESEAEKIPHHYVNSVLEVGNTHNVIVSFIDDGPWSFSVQLLSSETELQKLMDELSTTELVPIKPPIILGHPCIASSALYGNLCRGVVVSISRSALKVYFVDFGNTEDLPSSSIYELPPKFFKIRVLSQKFSLSGLQKVVYSDDIKKFFREVVQDELLMLRVMSLEDDNLPTCELYLKDKNIKRILNEKIRELRSSLLDDFPTVGETENVVVTWVTTPQKFFVQLHKRDGDLNALKNELAEVETKGRQLTFQQLSVGFKCVCLYAADGRWYRAVITSVDSENAITVFYVDYGNTETVSIGMLRSVEPGGLINQMSNQAIQCSLKGFEDKSFDQDLTQKLEALILEKDLQMTVVSSEKELLCVQLFENGKDITEMLLTETTNNPPQASSFPVESNLPSSYEKVGTPMESYDRNENKGNFRCEENWRDKSRDRLNESKFEDGSRNKIRTFKQTRESNVWEDSNNNTVIKSSNNNNTGVNNYSKSNGSKQDRRRDDWSDGGKSDNNPKFKQDKNRNNWEEKKDDIFGERKKFDENYGRGKFESKGGKRFYSRHRDSSRGEEHRKKFEKSENSYPERERKFEERRNKRKPLRKEDIAPFGSKFEEKNIEPGSFERGIVTYYFSPHEFFVQLLSEEKEFKKMMTEIQTYYSDKYFIGDKYTVQAGDVVIAQFSLDKVLYRAEVVKPAPVTVKYVDYGNQEPVGPKSIYFLDKQFLKLPKQVIKCRLSNIQPVGSDWSPPGGAADKFFESSEYICTILSTDGDVYEVSLKDNDTGRDVAQELIAAGFARPMTPALDVPEIDFSLLPNQVLRLYVSHVESSSKFYVILSPEGFEVIKNELKTFADDKNNLTVIPKDLLKPGTPCLSTSDDVWWRRGSVIKTDGDKILVWFYDMGDSVEVKADKVMNLPDYLKVFQPQAVKCSLHGNLSEKDEDEFKKSVEFKSHLVSIVSATKDSLSVVLYNEAGKKFDFQNCDDFQQDVEPIGQLPIISQKLPVVISHFDSPNAIYIQRVADLEDLHNLLGRLNSFYLENNEGLDFKEKEMEGKLVAANSVIHGTWCRGRLLSSSEDGFEVFYIDYGNTETLPKENVKKLHSSFLRSRAFCKKVTIDLKFETEKSEELKRRFLELCRNENVLAYFVNSAGEFICEFIVKGERLTQKFNSTDLSINKDDIFSEMFLEKKNKPEVLKTASQASENSEDLKVFVSHIDSPNQFWVHKESVTSELHQFQDKLQKFCEVLPDKKDFAVGDMVAALYYDMWYRAQVTNVDGNKLTVQFIDYGNTFVVDLSSNVVKQLTKEFLSVPVFATPYALKGTWSESSTSKFEEIILQNEEPVRVVVLEESQPVVVDLYQNGESVTEMLKSQVENSEKEGDFSLVYITHANSANDFYIHREGSEDTLQELNDRLLNTSEFENPSSIKEDEIYAAEFPADRAWYRAKVRKVQEGSVEVVFIDYGNVSNVTELKCLPSDLVDIPILAENCRLLYGDNCDSWSPAACEKFLEYTDGRKLRMEVVVSGVKKQIVKLFDGSENITKELEKLCEPDGRTEVSVSYALSPTDFYIQYVDDHHYKQIAEKLENGDEAEDLVDAKPGTLCQARFLDDGCWYRAKILKNLDEGCEVFFVDFGNSSAATELKKLPSEIAEIPPRALHCSLNLPEINIPESVKEEFINLVVEDAPILRALVISSGEINKISLKLDGRIIEETLNFGEFDSFNHESSLHSVECETDDGKHLTIDLSSQNCLADNLKSVLNETDEEKTVKVGIGEIDVSGGFKSDDDKNVKGSVSSGFVNATDNELMDEMKACNEGVTATEASTVDDVETPETSVEDKKNEREHQEVDLIAKENKISSAEEVNNGAKSVEDKMYDGENVTEKQEIPMSCHKQPFSEKSVTEGISNGIHLDVKTNEKETSEE